MAYSRLARVEEKRQKRKLVLAITGILAIITLSLLFGIRALIAFSLFVDTLRGNAPPTGNEEIILVPPTINPPPTATNSARIAISGKGTAGFTVILYVNNSESSKVRIQDDGTFEFPSVSLSSGANTISAKVRDDKEHISELSNIVSVAYGNTPPKLTVSDPQDEAEVSGDTNTVTVNGITDDNVTITINDRFVVIKPDSTFSYQYPLNEGENILTITATDEAGNQSTLTRKVTYHR